MIKVRRMCGGGVPVLRRRFWWRYPAYSIDWTVFVPRRVDGAVISDWAGWALAWGPGWPTRRQSRREYRRLRGA